MQIFSLTTGVKSFLQDTNGSIIVYGALVAPILIGLVAIGVDVTFAFTRQRQMQIAADAASYSAAMFISTNRANPNFSTTSSLITASQNQAIALVKQAGFSQNITANTFYDSNVRDFTISVGIFENRYFPFIDAFKKLWNNLPVPMRITVQSRAIASASMGQDFCYLALSNAADTSDTQAFNIQGSTSVSSSGNCGIAINSNDPAALTKTGTSGSITVPISDSGGYVYTGTPPTFALSYASQVADPYALNGAIAALAADYPTTAAVDMKSFGKNNMVPNTLAPGRYSNTASLTSSALSSPDGFLHLQTGGKYYFDDLNFKVNIAGSNVLLIVSPTATSVDLTGSPNINLSGVTNGTYAGLLITSLSPNLRISNKNAASLKGGSSAVFTGGFYFPNSDINFQGGGSATNNLCAQMIAQKINLQGNSFMTDHGSNCSIFQNSGTSIIRYIVRLIQ